MVDQLAVERLERGAYDIKIKLLKLAQQTVIHIGGDLSVADLMTALWQYKINYRADEPKWEERDRFVLSKGHASAVTSFCQASIGCYNPEEIYAEYATDMGRFGMHSCNLKNPHVEVSTGSLGHGLPVSGGIAAALRAKGNRTSRVYTVVGDGELDEGSMWETIMLAPHMKLGNLVVLVDKNGLSFDGPVEKILDLGDFAKKFTDFGWNVQEIDGHEMDEIVRALDALPAADSDKPSVIIGHTVKGHGVSFMESAPKWHAGMLSDSDHAQALEEITAAFDEGKARA